MLTLGGRENKVNGSRFVTVTKPFSTKNFSSNRPLLWLEQ